MGAKRARRRRRRGTPRAPQRPRARRHPRTPRRHVGSASRHLLPRGQRSRYAGAPSMSHALSRGLHHRGVPGHAVRRVLRRVGRETTGVRGVLPAQGGQGVRHQRRPHPEPAVPRVQRRAFISPSPVRRRPVRGHEQPRPRQRQRRGHLPRHPRGGARDSPAPPGHQGAAHRYPTAGARRGLATADAARALRVGRLRRPANHARGPGNRAQTQVLPARRAHAGHRHRQRTPEGTRRRFGRISVLCGMRSRVLNPRRNRHPPGAHA